VRYVPPWGISDPDAPYVNGDPTIGRQGSIPPAAALEHPMRELVAVIAKSGITPSELDLSQLLQGVRSQRLNFAEDTGTTNNLAVAFDPPLTGYNRGLVLRVRVRNTNTGPCRINAGAGTMPIRKMNGADVGEGELPVGCLATLVFDGTAFQLSNFGGGGGSGAGDVFMVKIPYTVDVSDTPGIIRAEYSLPVTELGAGDILAVKVAHTNPGATRMYINNLAPIDLLPNGGGIMLQGDIAAGDVVQFFFDGDNLRFPPNPEINAPVTYTVGQGQQFPTVDAANDALKRKTIGANGFVTLQLVQGVFQGPIALSHPSGDRLAVRGTMIGAAPVWGDFARTGNSPQQRAQDAIFNINMLRTRYGTEVRIPPVGNGLINAGPGLVQFHNLLVTGDQLPMPPGQTSWDQNGVALTGGFSEFLNNVTVWGAQAGFVNNAGGMHLVSCFACANSHYGIGSAGSASWAQNCGAYGNGNYGFVMTFGSMWMMDCSSQMNAGIGIYSDNTSGCACWWGTSLGNGTDLMAQISSSITFIRPGIMATSSPALGVVGNYNSMVVAIDIPRA
jgi:hypothetical protein